MHVCSEIKAGEFYKDFSQERIEALISINATLDHIIGFIIDAGNKEAMTSSYFLSVIFSINL